jgi:membrane-anchored protein YejM (alkaline phosphatase superfamily)
MLFLMFSTQLFYGYRNAIADSSIMMQIKYIPWAQPSTMKRSLRKIGVLEKTTEHDSFIDRKYSAVNYPKKSLVCTNSANLNYLMIVIDSLRFDMLDAKTMPNTFNFSLSSHVFSQHWSTSNSTRFGLFGLFYGIPSTYWFNMLEEQRGSVLFDVLNDNNYQLHLDASAPLNSPEFDRTIFSRVKKSLKWGSDNSDDETDTVVINRLLTFLKQKHDEYFFAFAFLDAPHSYKLPKVELPHFLPALKQVDYLDLNNDYSPEAFLNLYKSAVYYNDRLLGQVYKKLDEYDLLTNTVIIITSDHGQEFNDLKQNYWGHNSNFSEYQVRVPLVIHWPGKPSSKIDKITSHEDIIPSLLTEGFGCQNKVSDYNTGFSLFNKNDMPDKRNLLLTNWNNQAIFTGDKYYELTSFGSINVKNKNYTLDSSQKVNQFIINQQLNQTSQFLK